MKKVKLFEEYTDSNYNIVKEQSIDFAKWILNKITEGELKAMQSRPLIFK